MIPVPDTPAYAAPSAKPPLAPFSIAGLFEFILDTVSARQDHNVSLSRFGLAAEPAV